jgi:hypothetical protein
MPDNEMHFLNLERYQILNNYVNGGSKEMVIMYNKLNNILEVKRKQLKFTIYSTTILLSRVHAIRNGSD